MADPLDYLADYKPGKQSPDIGTTGDTQQNIPDYLADYSPESKSTFMDKVGGVGRAALSTILGAKLFVPTTAVSGLYGLGKATVSLAKGEGIDKALEIGTQAVEAIPSAINKAILTTPESQSYAEKVGGVLNWPIEKSAAGWKGITELATTGDLQKATDVIKGEYGGSNLLVPAVGTLAEANALGAMFGRPGIKEGKIVPIAEHGAIGMGAQKVAEKIGEMRKSATERVVERNVAPPIPPIPTVPPTQVEVSLKSDPMAQKLDKAIDNHPDKTIIEITKSPEVKPETQPVNQPVAEVTPTVQPVVQPEVSQPPSASLESIENTKRIQFQSDYLNWKTAGRPVDADANIAVMTEAGKLYDSGQRTVNGRFDPYGYASEAEAITSIKAKGFKLTDYDVSKVGGRWQVLPTIPSTEIVQPEATSEAVIGEKTSQPEIPTGPGAMTEKPNWEMTYAEREAKYGKINKSPSTSRTIEDVKSELEDRNQELADHQQSLLDAAGDKESQTSIREDIKDTKAEISLLNKELKDFPTGPGAQTSIPNIPETPSSLTQLRQSVEAMPPRPKSEFSTPVDYSNIINNGVKRTLTTFEKVKSEASRIWDNWIAEPVIGDYEKVWGDYWQARATYGLEGKKWGKEIMARIPKSSQIAVTNYIQAGGDNAKLLDWAGRSKDPILRKGYSDAANLPSDVKIIAENVRNFFDSWLDKLQEADVLGDKFIEDYVNQVWDRTSPTGKQIQGEMQAGLFKTNPSLARKRIIESYFQGEQLGLIPKNKGIGFLVSLYNRAAAEALAARKAASDMFNAKSGDGLPVLVPEKVSIHEVTSKQYRVIDPNRESGRAVRVFDTREEADNFLKSGDGDSKESNIDISKYTIEEKDRPAILITSKLGFESDIPRSVDGRLYKPAPNHPAFKEFTWQSADTAGNPIFYKGRRALLHPDQYNNLTNAFKTSAIRQYAVGRAALDTAKFAKLTMLSVSIFHPVQLAIHAVGHTVDIFRLKDIIIDNPNHSDYAIQIKGIRAGLELGFNDPLHAVSEGVYGGGLIDRLPGIGPYSQKLGEYTFGSLLPRLKMTMFQDAFERNMKRYGNRLSEDQIASKTADEANAAFGGLNYQKMGRNPTFQDTLRLGLLAPDFLEARLRFAGQGVVGEHKEQTYALMRLAIGQAVILKTANAFLDNGNPHWDRPLSIVINGQEFTPRSVPGDILHAILDPRNFIYHRLNPTITRTLIEGLTGKDIMGRERDMQSQIKDLFVTHMPIPIQGPFRKGDQALWESAVSSLGLSTYKYKTAADREMSHILSLTIPQKQLDAMEISLTRAEAGMKDAIRNNKEISPEIMREINKLSPEQARRIMQDATRYTKFEDGFQHLNLRDSLKIWNKTQGVYSIGADEKEIQMAEQMIGKKYILAVKHSPNQINSLTDSEKRDLQGILERMQ